MKKTFSPSAKKWLTLAVSPHILFYLLPYMMVLLIAGTIAQKYVGLFTSTKMFFSSFILWVGFIPLPGGALALALLFLNLAAYFVSKSQWNRQTIGSSLTHLGVIVLLLGGLVTLIDKKEGFVILRHGQPANAFYDYHTREFSIEKNNKTIYETTFDRLKQGGTLTAKELPFPVTIKALHANSFIDKDGALKNLPAKKEEETNQAGLTFVADGKNLITTEFLQQQPSIKKKDGTYRFILKRASQKIPFGLELRELTQDLYPGTTMAESYETQFSVIEKDHRWPSHVSMNDPLRYKGYTFYQASVLTLPDGEQASVLNAVNDAGWLFPYAATGLICIGLLLNAWMRRHAK